MFCSKVNTTRLAKRKPTAGDSTPPGGKSAYDRSVRDFGPAKMPLTTIRVLLVEDEIMIRMMVADIPTEAALVSGLA